MFHPLQISKTLGPSAKRFSGDHVIASSKSHLLSLTPIIVPSGYPRLRRSVSPIGNEVGYSVFDCHSSPVSFCSTPTSIDPFSPQIGFSSLQSELPEALIRPIWTLRHEKELNPKALLPHSMAWSFVRGYMFPERNAKKLDNIFSAKDVIRQADFLIFTFKFFRTDLSKKVWELLNDEAMKPIILRGIKSTLRKEPNLIDIFGTLETPVAVDVSDFLSEELIDIAPKLARYDSIYTVDIMRSVTPYFIS